MSNAFLDPDQPFLDLHGPFRGSTAIGAGLLTRGVLRGPRYRRLFPDVYAPAELDVDLTLLARAAGVLVAGRGIVAGHAAAELLGASCAPPDAAVEVLMTSKYLCAGIRVRRERYSEQEARMIGATPVATADRVAYDLARWAPTLTERVAAVDALAHQCGVTPADVMVLRHRHLGAHGGRDVAETLALVDARAESPMESRIRVPLVLAGLPPEVQYPLVLRGRRYRLDLAYPGQRMAVEYDGDDHRTQRRARSDLVREAALAAAGWRVLRFDADEVLFRPDRLVAAVRAELATDRS
jgi:very-short-patch-repair endonuclease